jgi:drug/metabolite transporter (DMT)-like permease
MTERTPATEHPPSPSTYLWLATVPLIWGTHFVALKVVFEDYTAAGMLSARYVLIIAALLITLWVSERDLRMAWRDVPYLALFSLLMVTLYQPLFAQSVRWTSAGESALLISVAPLFTALTGVVLGWERATWRLWAGVGMGLLGVVAVVAGGRGLDYLPPTHVKGSLLMLGAAVLWGWYALLAKPLLARYSPLKVTAYCHALGGVPLIVWGWPNAAAVTPRVVSELQAGSSHAAWVLFGIAYYALFSGAYAFTIWYRGVQRLGPSRTMLFQFCVPVVGLLAAIIVRAEFPSALQWAGAAMALGGIVFASGRRKGPGPAPDVPGDCVQVRDEDAADTVG